MVLNHPIAVQREPRVGGQHHRLLGALASPIPLLADDMEDRFSLVVGFFHHLFYVVLAFVEQLQD